jgi:hypothetical protein
MGAVLLCVLIGSSHAVGSTGYTTTDLGVPPWGAGWGEALGNNDLGQVVGYTHPTNMDLVFLWDPVGGYTNLGRPAGWGNAYGMDINDRGEVIGYGRASSGAYHLFTWDASNGFVDRHPAGWARSHCWPGSAINNAGAFCGIGQDATGRSGAFVCDPSGTVTTLTPPGMVEAYATCINEAGIVAGFGGPFNPNGWGSAFYLWDGTDYIVPALPAGWQYVSASDINNSNTVVGTVVTSAGWRPFTWSAAAGFRLLDMPPGWGGGIGMAINDRGRVALMQQQPGGHQPSGAAVWDAAFGAIALDKLGWDRVITWDINNAGLIVGYLEGRGDSDNPHHPFLASPLNSEPVADAGGPYSATSTSALVNLDPDTLNLRSEGQWVTAYLNADPTGSATVVLDGSRSSDPDADPITGYYWTIMDPTTSAVLHRVESAAPLVPVQLPAGSYVVALVVSDGQTTSTNDAFTSLDISPASLLAVDPTTLYLNGVRGDWGQMIDPATLMVKFSRQALGPTLVPERLNTLLLTGALSGSDTIMVIDRGGKRR